MRIRMHNSTSNSTYAVLASPDVKVWLAAIDNSLRNGDHMTSANLAMHYLCKAFHLDRDELDNLFDPKWVLHGCISCGAYQELSTKDVPDHTCPL